MPKVSKGKKGIQTGEMKKNRNMEQNADVETHVTVNNDVDHGMQLVKGKKVKVATSRKRKNKDKNLVGIQKPEDVEVDLEEQNVDHGMQVTEAKKVKVSTSRKRKNKDRNLVGKQRPVDVEVDLEEQNVDHGMQLIKGKKLKVTPNRKRKNKDKNLVQRAENEEVGLEEQNDGVVEHCDSKEEDIKDSKKLGDSNIEAAIKPCRSKEAKKKRRKEVTKSPENKEQNDEDDIHIISSGDDDCSNGMKKWIMEYHRSRPGLEVLQNQIDEFITTYEEKLEEERKAKEALAAEGGWTVVVQKKGRKKTTDSESGIAVGSVAQAAAENNLAKKKPKEVGLDFYRFQKREAQRNELMELQSKFQEDKKRLQQLRAARKFRPY
ncbi:DNA ligase 1-like isoform X4 [Trifolium pratense]|uniref:DNA ligase 1-like isoform X4 n=1 Tax=Trifolium pratense TaxID=57577 RepID=UPI001E6976FE|nr:DNA ligase 1-like isoform X4 [Trifolium pratense]